MAGNNEAGPSGTAKDNNSSGKYYFCQMHPLFPWIPSSSGSGTIVVVFKCSNTVVKQKKRLKVKGMFIVEGALS